MQKEKKYCLGLLVALICCHHLLGQNDPIKDSASHTQLGRENIYNKTAPSNSLFAVRNIIINGNRKTKTSIILREIPFKPGEAYPLQELVKKFEDARRQLMNTSLFHEVVVALKSIEGYKVDVLIDVKERWYLFPVPYFKPIDRNLNQWLIEQKASFSRVNYGVKLLYYNATGHNDKFRFIFMSGYTKQFSISYDRLYFDKKMKWGLNTSFNIGKNREVNYNTINDKQVFIKDNNNYIKSFVNASAELTYRRAIKTRHSFGIGYTKEIVGDTIVALNPAYYKPGYKSVAYPEVYYNMIYSDLDYIPYPTKGYAAIVSVDKKGFNNIVNLWQLSAKGSGNWHLSPKTFFSLGAFGTIKLPFHQPYFLQRLLGYSDVFMQGYEYYVVDGVAGGYLKATLTQQFLNFKIKIPFKKADDPHYIPFKIYGKIFGNSGYIYNPQPGDNFLSNRMLYSSGIGIDILSSYDFTLKLEWTFNQLGQNGLFLHRKTIF